MRKNYNNNKKKRQQNQDAITDKKEKKKTTITKKSYQVRITKPNKQMQVITTCESEHK